MLLAVLNPGSSQLTVAVGKVAVGKRKELGFERAVRLTHHCVEALVYQPLQLRRLTHRQAQQARQHAPAAATAAAAGSAAGGDRAAAAAARALGDGDAAQVELAADDRAALPAIPANA